MRVFISKYDLKIIIVKVVQFLDKDNTVFYCRKESYDITNMYNNKLNIRLYTNKC
jgi:hypothetical protein